jgi:predicted nucleic acid-binding protein
MKLFLDTSVLLAACGSEKGVSRELFRLASLNN